MPGHFRSGDPSLTQNQGNILGDRPCVRQSRICREQMGGNNMKDLMGQSDLKWNHDQQQGVYQGTRVHGQGSTSVQVANSNGELPAAGGRRVSAQQQQQQQSGGVPWATDADDRFAQRPVQQARQPNPNNNVNVLQQGGTAQTGVDSMKHRPGAGMANRTTYNIFTGQ